MEFSVLFAALTTLPPYLMYGSAYLFPHKVRKIMSQKQFIFLIKFFKTLTILFVAPIVLSAGFNMAGACIGLPLFLIGVYLNEHVYRILGSSGVYYGIEFETVPAKSASDSDITTHFPYTSMSDPQFKGSLLMIFGGLMCCSPTRSLTLIAIPWVLAYFAIIVIENSKRPNSDQNDKATDTPSKKSD